MEDFDVLHLAKHAIDRATGARRYAVSALALASIALIIAIAAVLR